MPLFIPENIDEVINELSQMLTADVDNPTPELSFLKTKTMNYTIESVQLVNDFLSYLKSKNINYDLDRTFMRLGAYVGEVIKRKSPKEFHWYKYEDAVKINNSVLSLGKSLGTTFVLYSKNNDEMVFPVAKVIKYYEKGNENNLVFYANVIIENKK